LRWGGDSSDSTSHAQAKLQISKKMSSMWYRCCARMNLCTTFEHIVVLVLVIVLSLVLALLLALAHALAQVLVLVLAVALPRG
jgi:hypothetical protein